MKKKFLHKEAIISRGELAKKFFIIIRGRLLVMSSSGNSIEKILYTNDIYGMIESLGNKKWSNTIISDKESEVLFITKELFYEKVFATKEIKNLSLKLFSMSESLPI